MVSWLRSLLSLIVQIAGYAVFLKGFFPPKVVLQDLNTFLSGSSPFATQDGPQFDRLIVMVVDAMRADFMYSSLDSSMSFLHSLIESGNALPFTAFSNPPTVTLPRLKGITTGGTPSFIDAILNVADDKDNSQSLANTDSWIRQFKNLEGGRIIHFFGDDTWLKLFPPSEFFEKYEGTNSFFVSDFTEVDNNVTRHLDTELKDDRWDALILHYLGLDHIGHKGGPKSPFMKPKQTEMDEVVKKIYLANVNCSQSTLMVVMGDHGMNDVGNHGGSSEGETRPGMVFMSPKFSQITKGQACPVLPNNHVNYYSSISQIDLVPTLAALFNFPIPKNNLGVMIPELLDLWPSEELKRNVLVENCDQFLALLQEKFALSDSKLEAIQAQYEKLKENGQNLNDIIEFLKRTQIMLTESATNYSYTEISAGFLLIFLALLNTSAQLYNYLMHESQMSRSEDISVPVFVIVYALHFHGSSLIEEEHQIWWFLTISSIVFLFIKQRFKGGRQAILCIILLRTIKGWNNSGQKFSSSFTIASRLSSSENILWILIMLTYLIVTWLLYSEGNWIDIFGLPGFTVQKLKSNDFASFISFVVAYVTASLSFLFKLCQFFNDGNRVPEWLNPFLNFICESFGARSIDPKSSLQSVNVQISRIFTLSLLSLILARVLVGKIRNLNTFLITDLTNLATLALLHQSRAEIIPIFLIFTALRLSFKKFIKCDKTNNADLSLLSISAFILCVQNLSFFSVGNTNLLATLDLSNAYNGIANYDVFLVALLTFISNFAVPLYWSLAGLQILFEDGSSSLCSILVLLVRSNSISYHKILLKKGLLVLFFYVVSTINLVGSCVNLRYHLFIWSVFCPKLLYFSSWSVLMNFFVDFVLGFIIVSMK